VILVTLVFQGLTLPPLIRILGLAEAPGPSCEEREARRLVLEAALARLEEVRQSDPSSPAEIYNDLAQHYKHRLADVGANGAEQDQTHAGHYFQYVDLSRMLLDVERQAALRLRKERRITDEVLREIEHELDLSETRFTSAKSS
jgi:hypothetical protein